MQTLVFALVALVPMLGFILAIVAGVLASFVVASRSEAPYVPTSTANEVQAWVDELVMELDVDAEWIAIAESVKVQDARRFAFVRSAKRGIVAARNRIVARHHAIVASNASHDAAIATLDYLDGVDEVTLALASFGTVERKAS